MTRYDPYMRQCFELALKAIGKTSPNPYVGCVIVRDDRVLVSGYHKKSGTSHAELDAIENAHKENIDIKGATLICNLEPCCHTNKKTPPCAQRIIQEGISKVVIANLDPNPEVAGKGVKTLEEAGIEVITGVLKAEGEKLNEVFFTHISKKRPFIHLKWAQTLDGKIATISKKSKWITSEVARECVHKERSIYDAVGVGASTIREDNPTLSIRLDGNEEVKARVVFSKTLTGLDEYKVFNDEFKDRTLIANIDNLEELYAKGVTSIYIEGGSLVLSHFINNQLYDRVSIYTAPKLLGPGVSAFNTEESEDIYQALEFKDIEYIRLGKDILMTSPTMSSTLRSHLNI